MSINKKIHTNILNHILHEIINIRNTPTATGPNSYGKTKLGFCDHRKLFEKQLKEKADELSKQS